MQKAKLFVSSVAVFFLFLFTVVTVAQNMNPAIVPSVPFKVSFPQPYSPLPPDTINGHWSSLAPYAFLDYGVFIYNYPDSNGIFVGGGSDAVGTLTANFYLYNIASNTYSPRQPLPATCCLNKMVKVRGKFYVTSTVNNFAAPSGATYEYTPGTGWVTKATMNAPLCHESGIFVYNDSLIFCVGGATSGFGGFLSTVRYFNPFNNTWTTCPTAYPLPIDLTQGECIGNQVVMFAGYNGAGVNNIYRGTVIPGATMDVQWHLAGTMPPNPTGGAPYRECTGIVGNYMLFGPAQSINGGVIAQMWGFNMTDSTLRRFLPDMSPAMGNMHGIGVQTTPADSVRLYTIGGYTGAAGSNEFSKFAYANPVPQLPPYNCGTSTYTAISGTPGPVGDDAGLAAPIGFTFNYVGVNYTQIWICTNGFLVMGPTGNTGFTNNLCSTGAGDLNLLAPFWDDLNTSLGGNIQYTTQGSAPNRVFICQYTDVAYFSGTGTVTVQVRLYETNNTIDFLYGPSTPNPSATGHIGINKAPGGSGNIIDITPGANCGATTTSTTTCTNVPYSMTTGTLYRFGSIPVGINNNNSSVPNQYSLAQNYPNPFNPTTVIKYGLPKSGVMKLVVYDILGREVKTLVNEFKQAGSYEVSFDASSLASGVYFYKIEAGDFVDSKKMLLVK